MVVPITDLNEVIAISLSNKSNEWPARGSADVPV